MADLIDREFIKGLGGECIARRNRETGELIAITGIDLLPSAQPAQLGTDLAEVGTDMISRQSAVDYCEALMETERIQQTDDWGYGRERYNQTEVIQHHLEVMPSAQPDPQWIPITDKLPDLDKCVLATTSWGTITIAERWKDTKGKENWFVSEGECNAERDDIVAWKPLPEPYKGETDG